MEISAAHRDPELQPIVERLAELVSLLAQHDQAPAVSSLTPADVEDIREEISDVQTTARLLARVVARDMVRSGILNRLANSERAALSEAEFVRASILDQHIDLPEHADTVARIRKEVAQEIGQHQRNTPEEEVVKDGPTPSAYS